jgi:anti-sigma factor ChrR (cupin superfamily)
MPLTDEDKATVTRVADELRTGNTRAYIALRNALANHFPSKPDEGESIMAIIFNLLPQEARDDIAIVLDDAAARAAASKK